MSNKARLIKLSSAIILAIIVLATFNIVNATNTSELPTPDFSNLNPLATLLKGATTLLFIAGFTFIAGLTLLAVAVMMMIRYVYLTVLMILSPIVWLLWIFPGTKDHWKSWWSQFIRWALFAPAMMFFLYLTILVIQQYPNKMVEYAQQAGIAQNLENQPFSIDVALIGNLVAIIGLMIGGLFAANKMGIATADTFYGAAQGAGKGVGNWAGRKGKQYGTAPLRAKWFKDEQGRRTQSMGEKLVGWGSKKPTLSKWTGFGLLAKGITRLETTGGENILKQHEKAVGGMSGNDLKAAALTASGPRKIAVMKELQKRKLLGDVNVKELITSGNKALFERYQQGVAWGDVEHGAKMNVKIAEELRETGGATLESVREFVRTYKGKDIESSAIKDLYSGKAKLGLSEENIGVLGRVFADAFAEENYQMVPKIVPTMNAKERDNFVEVYGVLDADGKPIRGAVAVPGREEAAKAWKNTLSNYGQGFSAETSTGATTPPPTA